ncbi:helix-turn-helix transcriptional regulator [Halorussus aquaticus]|uniref:Helix-turn-helix transcriptional regulator n=1 Tax=Halorussus aquaticus TaxID=2953748 RepID=A0ABD5PYV4_9EURY|nr:hypothetical protein [Halorussus aquaticus]
MKESDGLLRVLFDRVHYLDFLQSTPAKNKRDIIDRFETPRSTVDRDIRKLVVNGLVERTSDGYRTTLAGRLASSEYRLQRANLAGIQEVVQLLGPLSVNAPLSAEFLRGARAIESTSSEPNRPITHVLELFERSRQIRVASPFFLRSYVKTVHDQVTNESKSTEMVLTSGVLDQLITQYEDRTTDLLDSDLFSLYEADSLPYGLYIVTTNVWVECGLVISNDTGIKGVIHNDTSAAVRWAESRFQSIRSQSTTRN